MQSQFSAPTRSDVRVDSSDRLISKVPRNLFCAGPYTSNPHLSVQFVAIQIYPGESASTLGDITSDQDLGKRIYVALAVYRRASRGNKTYCSCRSVVRQPFARCVARLPGRLPRVIRCELVL